MPLPLGIIFVLIAFIFLLVNKRAKSLFFMAFAISWFTALSYQPVVNRLLIPLEYKYEALKTPPKVEYIMVLGNGHTTNKELSITSQVNPTGINRFSEAFRLSKLLPEAKIIVSGYKGRDKTPHALLQKELALSFGVNEEKIITFPNPRDTKEEAIEAKKLLKNQKFILVTSASHMPRSMAIFEHEGLNPIPAPTNHLAGDKGDFYSRLSAYNLYKAKIAFHEYLGLLWGKIRKQF